MDYNEIDSVVGVPIRVPASEDYRRCSERGNDCVPDPNFGSDELGARIALACPEHGIQSVVDPFEDRR
ncbi:hypothetical protein [Leucobacter luti]|uniref:hypothetical protein n=1 Tax=Leucobacter luti TaxID=340320 RepID=UPI003D04A166